MPHAYFLHIINNELCQRRKTAGLWIKNSFIKHFIQMVAVIATGIAVLFDIRVLTLTSMGKPEFSVIPLLQGNGIFLFLITDS